MNFIVQTSLFVIVAFYIYKILFFILKFVMYLIGLLWIGVRQKFQRTRILDCQGKIVDFGFHSFGSL